MLFHIGDPMFVTFLGEEIVDILLGAREADVNAQDDDGATPLHYACLKDNYKAVRKFLAAKNINLEVIAKTLTSSGIIDMSVRLLGQICQNSSSFFNYRFELLKYMLFLVLGTRQMALYSAAGSLFHGVNINSQTTTEEWCPC